MSAEAGARWLADGREVHVIPNGCDVEHFARTDSAPPPDDVALAHPIAGVIGHLSPRIDASLLAAVADDGMSLLLVGPASPSVGLGGLDNVLARPNVAWVGPKTYEELPSYLHAMDVGLVPYVDDAFNRAKLPAEDTRVPRGRQAGRRDRPPRDPLLAADGISLASSPAEFAAAVHDAATAPGDPAAIASRRAVAADSSWDSRVAELARLLGLDTDTDTPVG